MTAVGSRYDRYLLRATTLLGVLLTAMNTLGWTAWGATTLSLVKSSAPLWLALLGIALPLTAGALAYLLRQRWLAESRQERFAGSSLAVIPVASLTILVLCFVTLV